MWVLAIVRQVTAAWHKHNCRSVAFQIFKTTSHNSGSLSQVAKATEIPHNLFWMNHFHFRPWTSPIPAITHNNPVNLCPQYNRNNITTCLHWMKFKFKRSYQSCQESIPEICFSSVQWDTCETWAWINTLVPQVRQLKAGWCLLICIQRSLYLWWTQQSALWRLFPFWGVWLVTEGWLLVGSKPLDNLVVCCKSWVQFKKCRRRNAHSGESATCCGL